jgi:hypothetical protein
VAVAISCIAAAQAAQRTFLKKQELTRDAVPLKEEKFLSLQGEGREWVSIID